jgi:hypothetical protein
LDSAAHPDASRCDETARCSLAACFVIDSLIFLLIHGFNPVPDAGFTQRPGSAALTGGLRLG